MYIKGMYLIFLLHYLDSEFVKLFSNIFAVCPSVAASLFLLTVEHYVDAALFPSVSAALSWEQPAKELFSPSPSALRAPYPPSTLNTLQKI
jgi:hypothetical protein